MSVEPIGSVQGDNYKSNQTVISSAPESTIQADQLQILKNKEAHLSAENIKSKSRVNSEDKKKSTNEISQSMLDKIQEDIKSIHNVDLRFSIHEKTGRTIVQVMDESNGKLIREIPPHEQLDLAAKVQEMMGILFNEKV